MSMKMVVAGAWVDWGMDAFHKPYTVLPLGIIVSFYYSTNLRKYYFYCRSKATRV